MLVLPVSKSEGERERIEPKNLIGILGAENEKAAGRLPQSESFRTVTQAIY